MSCSCLTTAGFEKQTGCRTWPMRCDHIVETEQIRRICKEQDQKHCSTETVWTRDLPSCKMLGPVRVFHGIRSRDFSVVRNLQEVCARF